MTRNALRSAPAALLAAALICACSGDVPTSVQSAGNPQLTQLATSAWLTNYLAHPQALSADQPAMLAGAGDIARCYPGNRFWELQPPGPDHPAQLTANLLDGMPGATVMAVGDQAYEFGSPLDYWGCYHPTWGRHRARTRPAT